MRNTELETIIPLFIGLPLADLRNHLINSKIPFQIRITRTNNTNHICLANFQPNRLNVEIDGVEEIDPGGLKMIVPKGGNEPVRYDEPPTFGDTSLGIIRKISIG